MSTKVKRTPLFGQDGHLGIPIIANNNKHLVQVRDVITVTVSIIITLITFIYILRDPIKPLHPVPTRPEAMTCLTTRRLERNHDNCSVPDPDFVFN